MAEKNTNIKDRVIQLAKNKGVALENFFENIGMSYGNFKGKSKKTALNSDAIAEIFTNNPDLNLEWLITGKGSMLKKNDNDIEFLKQEIQVLKEKNQLLQDKIMLQEKLIKMHEADKSNTHVATRPVERKLKEKN